MLTTDAPSPAPEEQGSGIPAPDERLPDVKATGRTTDEVVRLARQAHRSGRTRPLTWRIEQLQGLRRMLIEHEEAFAAALHADLGKGALESWVTEVGFLVNEIDHTVRHLRDWVKPRRMPLPLWLQPARARVVLEPLGVVLVIGPWNYPLHLTVAPAIGAIAAGNVVIMKPSELAPATSRTLAELVPEYLDREAVHVVEGGVPETTELLSHRYDHVFFTGSAPTGRVVLAAAAEHLTPVTLELGGKSPAYVDDSVDLAVTARRLVWGKFTNAGQTCVAPDYVLGTRAVLDELRPHLEAAIREFHGDQHPIPAETYGRIVNDRHFQRLEALLHEELVVLGGRRDAAARYIEPTVLDKVTHEHAVMQEEIFGPILPLVEVADLDEAIDVIVDREKPLALYAFTTRRDVKLRFVRETSSGALNFNAPLLHMGAPALPFGGVGGSGMGRYHGRASVELFSHHKPVLDKRVTPDTLHVLYPPSTPTKERILRSVVVRGTHREGGWIRLPRLRGRTKGR